MGTVEHSSMYLCNVCTQTDRQTYITLIFRWLDMKNNKCGFAEVFCHLFACDMFYCCCCRCWYFFSVLCSIFFSNCFFFLANQLPFPSCNVLVLVLVLWFALVYRLDSVSLCAFYVPAVTGCHLWKLCKKCVWMFSTLHNIVWFSTLTFATLLQIWNSVNAVSCFASSCSP